MDRICPLLGLAADRRSAVDGVDAGHRCHAEDPAASLDGGTQAQLCLTPSHERCERYLAYVSRTGTTNPGRSTIGDGFVTTRLVLAPEPAWRGIAGRARHARPTPLIAAGVGVLAVGLGTAAVAANLVGRPVDDPLVSVASENPTVTPTERAPRTPRPTRPPATPSPTIAPSPTPVPATPQPATPAPTAVPVAPAPQTYVVAEGDSLAAIAERFGTTIAALQAANDIDDPNSIVIGDVLVIP